MQVYIQTCTPDGHLHRVTYARCHIYTINSPDDEHMSARNIQRFGININEKRIVRQVGHLQESNSICCLSDNFVIHYSLQQFLSGILFAPT
jgi:hypothetical protein